MDERYIQDRTRETNPMLGTAINPVIDQMNSGQQAMAGEDEGWDLEAAADDNESFSIEEDRIE
jgi:hypothetical protein